MTKQTLSTLALAAVVVLTSSNFSRMAAQQATPLASHTAANPGGPAPDPMGQGPDGVVTHVTLDSM